MPNGKPHLSTKVAAIAILVISLGFGLSFYVISADYPALVEITIEPQKLQIKVDGSPQ